MSRDGLYTVIEAQLPGIYEGMHRLWLHGGGVSAYLGLMQPWSGGMYLRRKLSRQQMAAFPKNPEYASDCDSAGLHNHNNEPETAPAAPPEAPDAAAGTASPASAACPEKESACQTAPKAERRAHVQYFRRPDGSLLCFDGRNLQRLPR